MIYLVRHGQTEFNAVGRLQGHVDSPLTAVGHDQARRMGEVLRALVDPGDLAILSNPLGRARHSADLIAQAVGFQGEVLWDPDLMEIGMGSWDGLTGPEIDQAWPAARDRRSQDDWYYHSPDGETHAALSERLARGLKRAADHGAGARIIVSHGVAGRVLRSLYRGETGGDEFRHSVPQDAVFRLAAGRIERVDTPQT